MSKGYSSKKSAKAYTSCCYSSSNVKIYEANNNNGNEPESAYLIPPDDVIIDTKNYYFEKFHEDNYLLTSVRYGLRVCVPNRAHLSGLFVRLELVDDRTDQEVTCVKRERAGKRVLKGKTREEFDLSKHGNLKAKLDFRFRETSTDNIVEWFRLNVHLFLENQKVLTFTSEPFRTSVRSPTKKTMRPPPPPLNPTIVQLAGHLASRNDEDSNNTALMDEERDDESESDDDDDDESGELFTPQQKKPKSFNSSTTTMSSAHVQPPPPTSSGSFPFLPPYQQQPPRQ